MAEIEHIIDKQSRGCYGPHDTLMPSFEIFDYALTDHLRFGIKCPRLEKGLCQGTNEVCIFKRGLNNAGEGISPVMLIGAEAGDLIVDQTSMSVVRSPYLVRGHVPIEFASRPWSSLVTLIKNAGEYVSHDTIYRGYSPEINFVPDSVVDDVRHTIRSVRLLLGQPKNTRVPLIQTKQGVGYRLLMPRNLAA